MNRMRFAGSQNDPPDLKARDLQQRFCRRRR
jgi:hypothetical protein